MDSLWSRKTCSPTIEPLSNEMTASQALCILQMKQYEKSHTEIDQRI